MDTKALLEWLNTLCVEAKQAANKGDLSKAQQLGRNPALRDYFNNVTMLESMKPDAFVQWYPDKTKELNAMFEAYQQQAAQTEQISTQADRLTALEEKFTAMMARMEKLVEAQEAATEDEDPEPEPEQPKKRRAKKQAADEDAEEPEAPAEPDAEDDSDEAD